jgi:hypothetical protein
MLTRCEAKKFAATTSHSFSCVTSSLRRFLSAASASSARRKVGKVPSRGHRRSYRGIASQQEDQPLKEQSVSLLTAIHKRAAKLSEARLGATDEMQGPYKNPPAQVPFNAANYYPQQHQQGQYPQVGHTRLSTDT